MHILWPLLPSTCRHLPRQLLLFYSQRETYAAFELLFSRQLIWRLIWEMQLLLLQLLLLLLLRLNIEVLLIVLQLLQQLCRGGDFFVHNYFNCRMQIGFIVRHEQLLLLMHKFFYCIYILPYNFELLLLLQQSELVLRLGLSPILMVLLSLLQPFVSWSPLLLPLLV